MSKGSLPVANQKKSSKCRCSTFVILLEMVLGVVLFIVSVIFIYSDLSNYYYYHSNYYDSYRKYDTECYYYGSTLKCNRGGTVPEDIKIFVISMIGGCMVFISSFVHFITSSQPIIGVAFSFIGTFIDICLMAFIPTPVGHYYERIAVPLVTMLEIPLATLIYTLQKRDLKKQAESTSEVSKATTSV